MRLIHLTDPHLSSLANEKLSGLRGKRWSGYLSWRKNRRKSFLPTVLDSMIESIKAENADQILLTGDLIHIGLDTEIAEVSKWLSSVGSPEQVMLAPGNHDVYAKGSEDSVYKAWSDYLIHGTPSASSDTAGQFPVLRRMGKLSLIGVSTACVTPVFMATGELGSRQLEKLAALLEQEASEGQLVCLLIHHAPLPGMTKWRKALSDAAALETVLQSYPPVLIFHGHLHHNREVQWGNSRIYCTAAASSVSEASYRVIDIGETSDSWEFHMALKSVAIGPDGELGFAVVDEQSWQTPKLI